MAAILGSPTLTLSEAGHVVERAVPLEPLPLPNVPLDPVALDGSRSAGGCSSLWSNGSRFEHLHPSSIAQDVVPIIVPGRSRRADRVGIKPGDARRDMAPV